MYPLMCVFSIKGYRAQPVMATCVYPNDVHNIDICILGMIMY